MEREMTNKNNEKQKEALRELKEMIKENETIYTILREVSRSGMRRKLSVLIVRDNRIENITYLVANALDYKLNEDGHLIIDGTGFDVGEYVVYQLSLKLFGNGYKLKHKWL